MLHPVLLCGGSGTRLWPLSRQGYPKQFLPLCAEQTMLQQSVLRVHGLPGLAAPLAVASEAHRFLVAEQLRQVGVDQARVILEPVGRNTGPAVALAALTALESDPEAVLLAMPSDHVIEQPALFREAVARGLESASEGALVTFGIEPTHPETGYGYIRAAGEGAGVHRVAAFVEKPEAATAARYLAAGGHYWNSGIFLFSARAYLEELERHAPALLEACRAAHAAATRELDFIRADAAAFAECPSDSVDYAVMEHTERAYVVPVTCGWSDVGSWGALQAIAAADSDGNTVLGDVIAEDTEGCYVRADGRLVATLGIRDQIVVETADAVLVASRERAQEVKRIVERLRAEGRSESELHRRVYRPWGSYEGVADAERFQVKRIVVSPGQTLSLQMHHHRAEHWVVVRGTARVQRGDDSFLLSEDQSTYIPLGTVHRLENPGVIPLELIEVQSGAYLGEDDITRFDDVYGRLQE